MTKPITHVLLVVDMSGSMGHLASDVRAGLNTYVKDLSTSKNRFRASLTIFNTSFTHLCVEAKLADVPTIDHTNYTPTGFTALLDAIGKTVTEFEAAGTLAEDDRVLLVVQTDGLENASREFTWKQIRDMLDEREKTGKWAIVYLGQGADSWAQGYNLGQGTQRVHTFAGAQATSSTYRGLSVATMDYADTGDTSKVGETIAATPGVQEDK